MALVSPGCPSPGSQVTSTPPGSSYRTLRQVAWGGSWEGQTTIGVGTRARLPFKVTELTGPGDSTRLVIDVAHTW